MGRSLDAVIVSSDLPFPPMSGARIRTLNLALRLARRHRITFISHPGEDSAEGARFLREHGIETLLADRPVAAKSGLGFYIRLAANLASPIPYSAAAHGDESLRRAVRSHARRRRPDVWQLESTVLADVLADLVDAPRVIDAHNVESMIWRRLYECEASSPKRWYIREQWRKFEGLERRAFGGATRVTAVSEQDAALIRGRFGARNVSVVDNGIDRAFFESVRPNPDPKAMLFLGSLDWRPNIDAVGLLLDRIFPAVVAAEPSARLRIVGRKPPGALVRRAREMPGVEIHADVPDVRPFLATSGALVVPLRIGGGSRLKILEALACRLPVISTPVGAEGLELIPGKHYASVEAEDMAEEVLAHIRDPGIGRSMVESGRDLVLDRYDWDSLAGRLEEVWISCLTDTSTAN